MAGMPELGSKISLISKSDIRYEGQLYTVDPNECTIALANVRSYGTEDRETQFSIPPQDEIFDYILFRGTDIKDIRVVNNVQRVPNDPAIMQMQLSNQMGQQNFQQPFQMPVVGHVGSQLGPFPGQGGPGPYPSLSGLGPMPGSQLPPGVPPGQGPFPPQQSQQQQQQLQQQQNKGKQATNVMDLIGGSRSTTPVSLNSRKSPTTDTGVQVNQKDNNRRNQNQRGNQRERRDSGKLENQNSHDNRNQRNNFQNKNNWVKNQNQRNNQRPRGRGPQQQGYRQNFNNQNNKGRPQKTIKFESDYDFEQANNKFEELRSSLAKLKVGEEAKPEQVNPEQVNGEVDKKDDSGNETGAGEQEQEEDDVTVGYDKAKSFFDNISCEAATDRKSKNRNDWRHERKINSETFGVSSARRAGYYNNYNRNRSGNYYNNRNSQNQRNGNGGYRGGNNGYRNQRNYNNQRNSQNGGNPQHGNGTTNLPESKTTQSQPTNNQSEAVTAGGK